MIMFKKSLPVKIEGTSNNKSGRVAPAVFENNLHPDLTEESLKLTEYELVLGDDMNAVCNLDLDRSAS